MPDVLDVLDKANDDNAKGNESPRGRKYKLYPLPTPNFTYENRY